MHRYKSRCIHCKTFKKTRSVKIVNDTVVPGEMHPEVPVRGACRRMQLEAGKAPKQRSPVYAKLDDDLRQAKMSFSLQLL